MIKIIVFSDIKIYCDGLSRILSTVDHFEVVANSNLFEDTIDQVAQAGPDVALLDMTMDQSCHFAQQIMKLFPSIKIVALAVPEDEQNIFKCAQAGIAGYVARESSLDELIDTILCVTKGNFRCPAKIAACIFRSIRHVVQETKAVQPIFEQTSPNDIALASDNTVSMLTRREQQITTLMVEGLSNKQISNALSIEVSTVKNHVHNILAKMKLSSRAQVAALLQGKTLFQGKKFISPLPRAQGCL